MYYPADRTWSYYSERRLKGMTISKDELIQEITDQLQALSVVADVKTTFKLSETLTLFDLQFRLKCKLYELTNEEK